MRAYYCIISYINLYTFLNLSDKSQEGKTNYQNVLKEEVNLPATNLYAVGKDSVFQI
jgi:hypothetical protein